MKKLLSYSKYTIPRKKTSFKNKITSNKIYSKTPNDFLNAKTDLEKSLTNLSDDTLSDTLEMIEETKFSFDLLKILIHYIKEHSISLNPSLSYHLVDRCNFPLIYKLIDYNYDFKTDKGYFKKNESGEIIEQQSSLIAAIKLQDSNARTQIITFLINEAKVDINDDSQLSSNNDGFTALMYASYYNDIDTLYLLLKNKAIVNMAEKVKHRTALMIAIEFNNISSLKYLLSYYKTQNLSIQERNFRGETPLIIASKYSNVEAFRALLSHDPSSAPLKDNQYRDALFWASNSQDILLELLNQNHQELDWNHFCYRSTKSGKVSIVNTLLMFNKTKSIIDINKQDDLHGKTLLMILVDEFYCFTNSSYLTLFDTFLNEKADINLKDHEGRSVLNLISSLGLYDFLQLLFKSLSNDQQHQLLLDVDDKGFTALDRSKSYKHDKCSNFLQEKLDQYNSYFSNLMQKNYSISKSYSSSTHHSLDPFIGRDDEINKILRFLTPNSTKTKHIQIVGLGGIGKTTLAKRLISSLYKTETRPIIEINIYSIPSFDHLMDSLLCELDPYFSISQPKTSENIISNPLSSTETTHSEVTLEDKFNKLNMLINRKKPMILLDGAEIFKENHSNYFQRLIDILKPSKLVITTREILPSIQETFPLPPLKPKDSSLLYKSLLDTYRYSDYNRQHINYICSLLKHNPLFLNLSASNLGKSKQTMDDYIAFLNSQQSKSEQNSFDSISTLMKQNWRSISPICQQLLFLMSQFSFESIDIFDLKSILSKKYSEVDINKAINDLLSHCLINRQGSHRIMLNHIFLYDYFSSIKPLELDPSILQTFDKEISLLINRYVELFGNYSYSEQVDPTRLRNELSHIEHFIKKTDSSIENTPDFVNLILNISSVYFSQYQYVKLTFLFSRAFNILDQVSPKQIEHYHLKAKLLIKHSFLLQITGTNEDALNSLNKSKQLLLSLPDSTDLTCQTLLAKINYRISKIYTNQSFYQKALTKCNLAVNNQEKIIRLTNDETKKKDLVIDYSKYIYQLGRIYCQENQNITALSYMLWARDIQQQYLGSNHQLLLSILRDISLIYSLIKHEEPFPNIFNPNYFFAMYYFNKASSLFKKTIPLRTDDYNENHIINLNDLYFKAAFYKNLNFTSKALDIYKHINKIIKKHYDIDHLNNVNCIVQMASCYKLLNEYDKSITLFNESIKYYRTYFNGKHKYIVDIYNDISEIFKQKEDSKNCIKYMNLALNELQTNFNDPLDSRIAFQYFRIGKYYHTLYLDELLKPTLNFNIFNSNTLKDLVKKSQFNYRQSAHSFEQCNHDTGLQKIVARELSNNLFFNGYCKALIILWLLLISSGPLFYLFLRDESFNHFSSNFSSPLNNSNSDPMLLPLPIQSAHTNLRGNTNYNKHRYKLNKYDSLNSTKNHTFNFEPHIETTPFNDSSSPLSSVLHASSHSSKINPRLRSNHIEKRL